MATKIVNNAEVKCSTFIQCVCLVIYIPFTTCATCPTHIIFLDLTTPIPSGKYKHKAPHYAVFSRFLFSYTLRLHSSQKVTHKVSHPNKTTDSDPRDSKDVRNLIFF